MYQNKNTLKKTKTSIFLLRICSPHSKTHICNWNKNSETNVMLRLHSLPTISCWSNKHLKKNISTGQQTAASRRSIRQWFSGYSKWALSYFGLRWGLRVRTKHEWMEKTVYGTELGRITHSLTQLWLLRDFLWRCSTDVQEWVVPSCTQKSSFDT